MATDRHAVVVSKKWNNPEIRVSVTSVEQAMETSLPDFLAALVEAAGSPAATITKAQLLKKLTAAAGVVIEEMKAARAKLM